MTDTTDAMLQNLREYKGDQLGQCSNTWCDEPATREWMQSKYSTGFVVCADCYAILEAGGNS